MINNKWVKFTPGKIGGLTPKLPLYLTPNNLSALTRTVLHGLRRKLETLLKAVITLCFYRVGKLIISL